MQDIAGCRIVVEGVTAQEETLHLLRKEFPEAKVSDRRLNPSHGYRAVHLIVTVLEKSVEIQVRTNLQHLWAEYSEKCADVVDPALKYGGGQEDNLAATLTEASNIVQVMEERERQLDDLLRSQERHAREAAEMKKELDCLVREGTTDEVQLQTLSARIETLRADLERHQTEVLEARADASRAKEVLAATLSEAIAQVEGATGHDLSH